MAKTNVTAQSQYVKWKIPCRVIWLETSLGSSSSWLWSSGPLRRFCHGWNVWFHRYRKIADKRASWLFWCGCRAIAKVCWTRVEVAEQQRCLLCNSASSWGHLWGQVWSASSGYRRSERNHWLQPEKSWGWQTWCQLWQDDIMASVSGTSSHARHYDDLTWFSEFTLGQGEGWARSQNPGMLPGHLATIQFLMKLRSITCSLNQSTGFPLPIPTLNPPCFSVHWEIGGEPSDDLGLTPSIILQKNEFKFKSLGFFEFLCFLPLSFYSPIWPLTFLHSFRGEMSQFLKGFH